MTYIIIYKAKDCNICERVIVSVKDFLIDLSDVKLVVKDISEANDKIKITPAVFVDNELFCYGEINNEHLIKMINLNRNKKSIIYQQ